MGFATNFLRDLRRKWSKGGPRRRVVFPPSTSLLASRTVPVLLEPMCDWFTDSHSSTVELPPCPAPTSRASKLLPRSEKTGNGLQKCLLRGTEGMGCFTSFTSPFPFHLFLSKAPLPPSFVLAVDASPSPIPIFFPLCRRGTRGIASVFVLVCKHVLCRPKYFLSSC